MRYIVTGKEMKLLDQNTSSHFGVSSQILMEQAAMVFVQKLSVREAPQKVLVVCGKGNNGGDGIAAARLLNQMGIYAAVYFIGDSSKKVDKDSLFGIQKNIYMTYAYPVVESFEESEGYDCVIDAVFGTGLSRNIGEDIGVILDKMNALSARKIALDIASGISADTGEVMGKAFCADATYTFSFAKAGQYLWPGSDFSGEITVLPMGITEESFLGKKPTIGCLEKKDLAMLPARMAHSHKGTYGKLLIVAGSTNMAGAAYFSTEAAYRMGTGLVKVYTPEENRVILQSLIPEAILSTYSKNPDTKQLIADIKWADAVVLGPGIGEQKEAREILKTVLDTVTVPLVIDADALNLLAKEPELLLRPHMEIIVTPHLGEMARLTGEAISFIQTRLIESAREFAIRYDVICVLKDAHTITALPYGMSYINLSGNDGMATAGSGDVLAGILGALLSQGLKPEQAAPLGVYMHGLAGDCASREKSKRGLIARDIIEGIAKVAFDVKE